MVLAEVILSVLIAVLLTIILVAVFRRTQTGAKGYWSTRLFLFAMLFVANWAGGLWAGPFGPTAWGVRWAPFLISGVLMAVLLLFLFQLRRPRTTEEAERQAVIGVGVPGIVSVVLWILIVALGLTIVVYYAT